MKNEMNEEYGPSLLFFFFFYKHAIIMFLISYSALQGTKLFDVQSAHVIFATAPFGRNFFSLNANH